MVKKQKAQSKPLKKVPAHQAEAKKAKNQRKSIVGDILRRLGISKGHAGRGMLSMAIHERLQKGYAKEEIAAMLADSEQLKQAQQVEVERLLAIKEENTRKRRNNVALHAYSRLGINDHYPLSDKVMGIVRTLANQDMPTDAIVEQLDEHEVVQKSRRLHREKRAELERLIDDGIEERKKTRVNMADVIAYLKEKERKKFAATMPAQQADENAPLRRKGKPTSMKLAGAASKFGNPRTYDLPNMRSTEQILSERDRARKLRAQQEPVKAPVVEVVPEEVNVVPVVNPVPAIELVPEVAPEPETMQEPKSAPQRESIAVKPEPVPAPVLTLSKRPKREGSEVTVISRPDQTEFSAAVRRNCFDRCVITGARLRQRTEAAHLVEHKTGGADHYTNGLLLRVDLHRLFDAGLLAICPEDLAVYVRADALADDPDLQQYHGKHIAELHHPIDPANLEARWTTFQQLDGV